MSLAGKITTEIGVHATATKWFNLVSKQLHQIQNLTDTVHQAKLHQGEDWHHNETVKHWTYTIDGKVTTCLERMESVDEQSKTSSYKLFGGDIDHNYKNFKLIFQAIDDKDHGGAIIKWTVEYERLREEVDPPYGYIEHLHKLTKDIDGHLKV